MERIKKNKFEQYSKKGKEDNQGMSLISEQSAITIITLVITIIVMLILAGIVLSLTIG